MKKKGEKADNILRVTVQIGSRRFDEDLATQARIAPNIDALNEALATNPGRFAEWAMLEALARSQWEDIVGRIENVDADIKDEEARAYLAIVESVAQGDKPPTVDAIKARVQLSPRRMELAAQRRELKAAALAAKDAMERLIVGRKTMEHRKDSLLALASDWRKEMDGRLQVRETGPRPSPGKGAAWPR